MTVLTVEILNLFPFAAKAVFVLPVATNITSFVLFICPANLFLVFIAIVKWNPHIHALISEGGAGNITPWCPVKHFDYNFLHNAFRKVLLEQLTSRIGPSFRKVKNEMYTRHEDNKTVTETIPALDFIQKLIVHIPEKHFKMLRYYGIYAKHHKQEKKLLVLEVYHKKRHKQRHGESNIRSFGMSFFISSLLYTISDDLRNFL
ncbi:Putative transposase [uncultured Roseburia sp.]|nr:Putative transposase [uncultured Roseburia sp.]